MHYRVSIVIDERTPKGNWEPHDKKVLDITTNPKHVLNYIRKLSEVSVNDSGEKAKR